MLFHFFPFHITFRHLLTTIIHSWPGHCPDFPVILQCPWLFKPHRDSLLVHSAAYPFFPHFVLLGSSDYSMSCDSFFHFPFRSPAFSPLPFCRTVWCFLCRQTDVSIAFLVYFRIHRAGEAAHSDSLLHLHISISLWFISICTAGVMQHSDDNAPQYCLDINNTFIKLGCHRSLMTPNVHGSALSFLIAFFISELLLFPPFFISVINMRSVEHR